MTDALKPEPMQGLSAYLRAEASKFRFGGRSHDVLIQWARDVEDANRAARSQPSALTDALRDLLDLIHAGRFLPSDSGSEGVCTSLVEAGERALDPSFDKLSCPPRAILSAAGSRSSDAEDARRYRWLKENANMIDWQNPTRPHVRRTLDADIDKSMRSQPMGRGE